MVDFVKTILYNINCNTGCGSAWLEHLVWDQGVAGSNPVTPTKKSVQCAGFFWHIGDVSDETKGVIMSQKKLVFNPFLPLNECIPDGEPHVFGDRVYLFGSHDKEDGETFCMLDYTAYSAPVDDLSDWRCEGVIYQASQDPDYATRPYMYAPDVMQGSDGRYYLYYCMSGRDGNGGYFGPISVAVCDSPAGKYEYLGYVKNPDGTPLADYVCFDPGVMNDNGVFRIYYGTQYQFEEEPDFFENEGYIQSEIGMFGKSREEIISMAKKDSVMGPVMTVVGPDMLTVVEPPRHIIPYKIKGTGFEAHPFFEASSIRKVGETYYFIYSSQQNHELCYATSAYPDRDFVFGGTIVSNGDVGYLGRGEKDRLNMTGTTHGSMENINGQWYIFYHRLTHKSDYSRQACAEKITIKEDGSIDQVEITSCGLSEKPLPGFGTYPAGIACNISNGNMPHGSNRKYDFAFPHVANDENDRFIAQIENHTLIGFKYFDFQNTTALTMKVRGEGKGIFRIYTEIPAGFATDINRAKTNVSCSGCTMEPADSGSRSGGELAEIHICPSQDWTEYRTEFVASGIHPLYFIYEEEQQGEVEFLEFTLL